MLLCGTHDGLFALTDGTPDRVLDCGRVWDLDADGSLRYVATESGLYRSTDGQEWDRESLDGVPTSVLSIDGGLVVGTRPVGVYRRNPAAEETGPEWQPVGDLAAHPHGTRWRDRSQGDEATVRTLAIHPEDGILAGLEPGGVYAFEGDFWRQYGDGVHDDVHDLRVLPEGDVVAATGNGLYRTSDGESWVRIDVDFRDFWANYFRETALFDDRLYTSANSTGPEAPSGVLLDGPVDGDDTSDTFGFERRDVPTDGDAFVTAWAVDDGTLYAGTMRVDEWFEQESESSLLAYDGSDWRVATSLPAGATALLGESGVVTSEGVDESANR